MSEEFSPGIKILLGRIREFPEDFMNARAGNLYSDRLTWESLVGEVMRDDETFSKEEQKAVRDALRSARRARFDGAVMELLAKGPEDVMDEWNAAFNTKYAAALKAGLMTDVSKSPKMTVNSALVESIRKAKEDFK